MRRFSIILTALLLVTISILIMISLGLPSRSWQALSPNVFHKPNTSFTVQRTLEEQYSTSFLGPLFIYNSLGNIEVRGGDVAAITLNAHKKARALTMAKADELLKGIAVEIESGPEKTQITVLVPETAAKEQASADLFVEVPSGLVLNFYSRLGNITLENTEGDVRMQTDLGAIKIFNFTGNAALEASLGNIELRNCRFWQELTITARLGNVHIRGNLAQKNEVTNNLGSVEIFIPEGESYLLEGTMNLGSFSSLIPFQGQKTESLIRGIIGSGEQKGTLSVQLDLGSLSFGALE